MALIKCTWKCTCFG